MAYKDIVTIAISLDITAVSRAGFGILMFASDHVQFSERTRSYNGLTAVGVDFATDSDAFLAATRAFAADIPPDQIKIGRREAATATFTAASAINVIGTVYTVTIETSDLVEKIITYTTIATDEALSVIATGLDADAGSDALGLAYSVSSDDFVITVTPGTKWRVKSITANLIQATTTTETAPTMMVAITAEDDEFFFVASDDHSQVFVLALAADIEARTKIYFVAVQEVDNLGAFSVGAPDTMSKLKVGAFFRTAAWFHHLADTTFPEAGYVTVASPSDPGKKIWANNRVNGSAAAQDPATNLNLTTSQKSNLNDKNANYTEVVGGVTITRRGTVSGSDTFLISIVRSRDFLEARITENYQNFLINSPVVPFTDSGITNTRGVLSSTLDRYVETETQPHILQQQNPYTIDFPRRKDVSFADVAAGEFKGSFTAFLSGAIRTIEITGSLTFEASS